MVDVLGYFGYKYLFGAIVGSILVDVFGSKKSMASGGRGLVYLEILTVYKGNIGLAVMGESVLVGFATNRTLFGLSEGPDYVVINKSLANWVIPKQRRLIVGFRLLSMPLRALLAASIAIGLLVLSTNWRFIFIVLGLRDFLMLIVFIYFSPKSLSKSIEFFSEKWIFCC